MAAHNMDELVRKGTHSVNRFCRFQKVVRAWLGVIRIN